MIPEIELAGRGPQAEPNGYRVRESVPSAAVMKVPVVSRCYWGTLLPQVGTIRVLGRDL